MWGTGCDWSIWGIMRFFLSLVAQSGVRQLRLLQRMVNVQIRISVQNMHFIVYYVSPLHKLLIQPQSELDIGSWYVT